MNDQNVTFQYISHMIDKKIIDFNVEFLSCGYDSLSFLLGDFEIEVIVLRKVEWAIPDVIIGAGIT